MSDPVSELFDEFRHDHQTMGRGLFAIAKALRAEDDQAAGSAARAIDRAAGAHIKFEELYFYPELRALLGNQTVDRFAQEHSEGLAAMVRLTALEESARLSDAERKHLLDQIETMRAHTDECGEHFGALGRIPRQQQESLLAALRKLRSEAQLWTQLATGKPSE
ncbi:hemerythrin domain-containing protein [Erythrobacter insulae]|uniref:Hemerythrin domain-containing protein n=1 Tax=Erythrobacter insulae TaxID=2584124 RepID=A0A547PBX1_9SPHN|nr:hemerythrin domain-containing protein [Erythrobacter insulae]TRD11629.1 hemerythrin domain-containing protein [Erythrobacter insulae]